MHDTTRGEILVPQLLRPARRQEKPENNNVLSNTVPWILLDGQSLPEGVSSYLWVLGLFSEKTHTSARYLPFGISFLIRIGFTIIKKMGLSRITNCPFLSINQHVYYSGAG